MDCIAWDMLETEDFVFDVEEVVAQRFPSHFEFVAQPRKNTGLFILCADIQATLYIQNRKAQPVQKGDILLLPQGARYRFVFDVEESSAQPHSYVINFIPRTKDGTPHFFDPAPVRLVQKGMIDRLPLAALDHAAHDLPLKPLRMHTLFSEILCGIFDMRQEQDAGFYPIRNGVRLLRLEWAENHSISRYAAACKMSESYFHALFRSWANMTPVEYRNRLRISYAASYLKNTDLKIEEIARCVGFNDPFYFSRIFKKITGLTPREYKRA